MPVEKAKNYLYDHAPAVVAFLVMICGWVWETAQDRAESQSLRNRVEKLEESIDLRFEAVTKKTELTNKAIADMNTQLAEIRTNVSWISWAIRSDGRPPNEIQK